MEATGFELDAARKLRAWRALNAHGSRLAGDMEGVKYLLSPLLARSAKEQEQFYEVFGAFWAECVKEQAAGSAISGSPLDDLSDSPTPDQSNLRFFRRWWWVLPALVAVFTAPFAYRLLFPEKILKPVAEMDKKAWSDYIRQGDTLQLINTGRHFDSTRVRWEIRETRTGKLLLRDSTLHTTWIAPDAGKEISVSLNVLAKPAAHLPKDTSEWPDSLLATSVAQFMVQCPDPPEAGEIIAPPSPYFAGKEYQFEIQAEKGCRVKWYSREMSTVRIYRDTARLPEILEGNNIRYTFKESGNHVITARVYREGRYDDCYTEVSKTIPIGSDKPYLRLYPLRYDTPLYIIQVSWLGWLMVFFPLLPAGFFLYRWWAKRNEKHPEKALADLEAEYPIVDAAPYHIPYLPQEEKITVPREFFRIAEILRRREESERRTFDANASIRATIAGGGFPVWRDRVATRPADYLFWVKRPDERDQQARLIKQLCDFMAKRDAPVAVFFHDGHFDRFRSSDNPQSLDLNQLWRKYAGCRLVILGDGHGLVNEYASPSPALLNAPLEVILRWPRRLLLTPEPVTAWSYQEALLHRVFLLHPADTAGILEGLERLDRMEQYDPGPFDLWQSGLLPRHSDPNPRYCNFDELEVCRDFLRHDSDCWRWLCALAVCAQPDWSLTIAVGRAIGVEVTHDRLLTLTRIPWLRANSPNNVLRLQLLAELSPSDEKAARQAVVEELNEVEEQVRNGFARTDWQANLAVQRFALDPRDEAQRRSLGHLHRLGLLSGSQQAELDWLVKREKLLPDDPEGGFLVWLEQPVSEPVITINWLMALIFILLTIVLIFVRPFGREKKEMYDEAIALNNRAANLSERMATEETWSAWSDQSDSVSLADSLFRKAISSRAKSLSGRAENLTDPYNGMASDRIALRTDTTPYPQYSLADSNRIALLYNHAARWLNFYLSGSISFKGAPMRPVSQALRDSLDKDALRSAARVFGDLANLTYLKANDARRMDAQHGLGLCYFYLKDTARAEEMYERIQRDAPAYFDTLDMLVNLRTLLDVKVPLPVLRALVVDALTGQPISNVQVISFGIPAFLSNLNGLAEYEYKSNQIVRSVQAVARAQGYQDWSGILRLWTATSLLDTIRMIQIATSESVIINPGVTSLLSPQEKLNNTDSLKSYLNLANSYMAIADYSRAEKIYLEIYERLIKNNSIQFEPDLAEVCSRLGILYYSTQKLSESESMLLRSLEIYKRLSIGSPSKYEPPLASIYMNLGALYHSAQKLSESESMLLRALEIYERLAKSSPTGYEEGLARVYMTLGNVYHSANRLSESEKMLLRSLEIYKQLAKNNSSQPDLVYTMILNNLGTVYSSAGKIDSALVCFEEALSINLKMLGSSHPTVANTYRNIATTYQAKGEYDKAIQNFIKYIEITEKIKGTNSDDLLYGCGNLGKAYFVKGENDKAIEYLEKSLTIFQNLSKSKTFSQSELEYIKSLEETLVSARKNARN